MGIGCCGCRSITIKSAMQLVHGRDPARCENLEGEAILAEVVEIDTLEDEHGTVVGGE